MGNGGLRGGTAFEDLDSGWGGGREQGVGDGEFVKKRVYDSFGLRSPSPVSLKLIQVMGGVIRFRPHFTLD
jgi:hypothetical protein